VDFRTRVTVKWIQLLYVMSHKIKIALFLFSRTVNETRKKCESMTRHYCFCDLETLPGRKNFSTISFAGSLSVSRSGGSTGEKCDF
jgi:hypothetical protein